MLCLQCQTENPEAAKFCQNCGAELAHRCSNCQEKLAPDARFCMFCGERTQLTDAADEARRSQLVAGTPEPLAEKVRAAREIAGERRVVTVLFIDVVGSTALAERLDVETWTAIMNGAFEVITPAVYYYEGTVARMMGDALVAFFGAPVAHEDDPIRAVRAALDVLDYAREYAEEVKSRYGIEFAMRATLSRGPVVIESVGKNLQYDYTPLGGVVNLAARIKFAAEPMSVLISEDVFRFVEPLFVIEDRGSVEVRGRDEPVRVFRVQNAKDAPDSLRGITGLESPMVGRQAELGRLLALCDAVSAGLERTVVITGEPGLGKSRLVNEFQASISQRKEDFMPQWAEGRCLSYGTGLAYHLLHDLVRSLLGVSDAATEAETRSALERLTAGLDDAGAKEAEADVYPFLAHLLSVDLTGGAQERLQRVDPQALQTHYLNAFRWLIETLVSLRPLVLVLEDLHWADPSSIEVFIRLLPVIRTYPLLLCLITRAELESSGWKLVQGAREILGGGLLEISLTSLSESDSRELVSNLLEIEALDEDMRTLILRRAEGNPFFVEEVIRMLIEQRAIVPMGEGWAAGARINEVEIPVNLQGLLMARIDGLPEDERQTLRVASVVGRQFPVKVLEYVLADPAASGGTPGGTRSRLNFLEAAGLVSVAQFEPDLEYLFRHSLVQDAAYGSLLTGDRGKLHLAVGEAVEQLYPDRLEEFAAMLARHFGAAGDDERSARYCDMAGDSALASFANREAEGHYRCALGSQLPAPLRAEIFTKLGEALFAQSRFDEAKTTWFEGIEVFRAMGEDNQAAHLYARIARSVWHSGDTPESLKISLEGLEQVEDAPDSTEKARLLHEVGRCYYFNGQPDEAAAYCQRALEMAEAQGAVDVQADTLATMGVLPMYEGEMANEFMERAIELAEPRGYLTIAARAHHNLSTLRISHYQDIRGAREHIMRAAEIHHERGNVQREIYSRMNAMSITVQLGNLEAIEAGLAELKNLLDTLDDPSIAELEVGVAELILRIIRGTWQDSLESLREYQEKFRQRGDLQMLNNVDNMIVSVYLDLDHFVAPQDLEEIETELAEMVDIADRGLADRVFPRCQQGIVMVRQNQLEEAHLLLSEVVEIAGEKPSIFEQIAIWDFMSELAVAQNRLDDAIEDFNSIIEADRRLERRWEVSRFLISLGDAYAARGQAEDFGLAHDCYQEASEFLADIGAETYVEIIDRRLLGVQDKTLSTILASHKVAKELAQAGKIQGSFLPERVPEIEGWSLSAVLEPARETSGDYYDFIQLPEGRLGILIADVTDKGAGAALFMASSRTLIRTYAGMYPDQPERVIQATNERLVLDTHGGLFVTLFYGVLEPESGRLVYCNAGHNPPYLFRMGAESADELSSTGMTIGILEDQSWEQAEVRLSPGDFLVMYTDGVPDAENSAGEFYDEGRLIDSGLSLIAERAPRAADIQKEILDNIHAFVGSAEATDDLTMVILSRE